MIKFFRASLFVTLILSTTCYSRESQASQSESIKQDAFKNCDFQLSNTIHITVDKKESSYSDPNQGGACSYDLGIKGFHTLGDQYFWLFIVDSSGTKIDQAIDYSGFKKKQNGNWSFIGHSFSIGKLIKYKNLSFKAINNGKDTTLVGRQIEHGTDQTGTPMTFEGVHILRISPSYAISIDMPFDQDTPLATRDEVVKELTQMVNSVHSAPEASATSTPTAHQ